MTYPKFISERFTTENGFRITVQVPQVHADQILEAVLREDRLRYGDYEAVSFQSQPGAQRFRSLGSGRNEATEATVEVPCVELSFFLGSDEPRALQVLAAVYTAHPYEEPVVLMTPCTRTLHIRGLDEDNPNRFWNRKAEDWVPDAHR